MPVGAFVTLEANEISKLNHSRSVLKIIDAMQRERSKASAPLAASAIGKAIARVAAVPDRRDHEIVHECAVRILRHLAQHHDLRVVAQMIAAISDEKSRAALRIWFCRFGALSVKGEGDFQMDNSRTISIGDATASPYWKLFPRIAKRIYDPILDIERAIRLTRRQAKEPGYAEALLPILRDLEALVERHRSKSARVEDQEI